MAWDEGSFLHEYVEARLTDIADALAELDSSADPLADSFARRALLNEASALIGALPAITRTNPHQLLN